MKLVSIILPYFNKRSFISKTLQSLSNQTYKNFEVIIIYDQENLEDFNYISNLISSDNRFFLYRNKKNLGVSHSRNLGINYSRGEYICFLDSDDLWESNKIEAQYKFMMDNNLLFSHTSYKIINKSDKIIGIMKAKANILYDDLIKSCDIGLSTVMFHNSIKNKMYFPTIKTKEDYALWLKLSKEIKIIGFSKNIVSWRKVRGSLSDSIIKSLINGFIVYNTYERKAFYLSILYLFRLSFYSFIKKIKQKIEMRNFSKINI
jgi:teichuronic acid biosynthesis glycosyltransferase TuaG